MNLKKILVAAFLAVFMPTVAMAHGELWYDASSHFPQYKKIVVYPIQYSGKFLIEDEFSDPPNNKIKSEVYQANDYFNKRFVRKLKVKTTALGVMLDDNKHIRLDEEKYKPLFDTLNSPVIDKAEKVTSVIGADGFIIPMVDTVYTEPHHSPAKTVTVQMKSWTEEVDGPSGNITYDVKNWNVTHTIPARDLMLYHMGLKYDMYDREGKKIMTYRNAEHTYGNQVGGVGAVITNAVENIYGVNIGGIVNAIDNLFSGKQKQSLKPDRYKVELFKRTVDEFRKDLEDAQKNFKNNHDKKKIHIPKIIGFGEINLPQNVGGDEYALKSIYFGMKDSAYKYTDLKVDYNNSGKASYFVKGRIDEYSLNRRWIEPHVTLVNSLLSEDSTDWYDSYGNKHVKKVRRYQTDIVDHHGYWEYYATVRGTFNLVDFNGKIIVSHSATEIDDKTADAYDHFMKGFYDKVNSVFGRVK